MARISKYLDDEVVRKAEEGLKRLSKSKAICRKLEYIILAKKRGITNTANFCLISKNSIIKWIKEVKNGSVELLNIKKGRGRKSKLREEEIELVNKYVEDNSNATINEVNRYILSTFGIKLGKSTVHRIIKKN